MLRSLHGPVRPEQAHHAYKLALNVPTTSTYTPYVSSLASRAYYKARGLEVGDSHGHNLFDKRILNRNNIPMKSPLSLTPIEAFAGLAPIMPVIGSCLEDASYQARTALQGGNPEPAYHASSFRYRAAKALKDAEQQNGFTTIDLPSNGLFVRYDCYNLKIWKARFQQVPSAGRSRTRRVYLSQWQDPSYQLALPIEVDSVEYRTVYPHNLVLLWDVTRSFALKDLILAYPHDGGGTGFSVAGTYWSVAVPAEILLGATPTTASAIEEVEIDEDEDIEDINFERLDKKTRESDTGLSG